MKLEISASERLGRLSSEDWRSLGSLGWAAEHAIRDDLIFLGEEIVAFVTEAIRRAPESSGKVLLTKLMNDREICLANKTGADVSKEPISLIQGTLLDLLSSGEVGRLIDVIQSAKKPDEGVEEAFMRLFAPMVRSANGVEIIDQFFGNRILQSSLGEELVAEFWLTHFLSNNLKQLRILTGLPEDRIVTRGQGLQYSELQRLNLIIDFVSKIRTELGSETKITINFYKKTHHTRLLRFWFDLGHAYFNLGDGIDSFDPKRPRNSSIVNKMSKEDWHGMINEGEYWNPGYGQNLAVNVIEYLDGGPYPGIDSRAWARPRV